MAEESGVVVRRRSSQEIARLAASYRKSGMGRSKFCRSHGMALNTLVRHLEKQAGEPQSSGTNIAGESRLMAVELAAVSASAATGKRLCKALLDWVTDRAHIIETRTESFRFRRALERSKKR